jgi:hypothetical protein
MGLPLGLAPCVIMLIAAVLVLASSMIRLTRLRGDINADDLPGQYRNAPDERPFQFAMQFAIESVRFVRNMLDRRAFELPPGSNFEKSIARRSTSNRS